jgi:type IV pilus assembly protein PilY1
MSLFKMGTQVIVFVMTLSAGLSASSVSAATLNLGDKPLFVSTSVPPLTMLVMGKDHKLYYEAYNDATDLNQDGIVDVGYQGYHTGADIGLNVDYYGYFNSYVCYHFDVSDNRFEPASAKTAAEIAAKDKTCAGGAAGEWSGDFLNYVTTARIDALRKVFYGGYRETDTAGETVLQRTHIPQDAHAWGKEYKDVARDGYDISNYTNLSLPSPNTYHIFANVSLSSTSHPYGSNSGTPRLRVLNDTTHRVWEWLSKERPVAGADCINGLNGPTVSCEKSASTWSLVSPSMFSSLSRSVYDTSGSSIPNNAAEYDAFEAAYATSGLLQGTDTPSSINGSGNPHGSDEYYMSIFTGKLSIPSGGAVTFAVDGDDAVEFLIDDDDDGNFDVVASWYGGHGANNSDTSLNSHSGSFLFSAAGDYSFKFRHQEHTGGDSYRLYWRASSPASVITDYDVNVQVCTSVDRDVSHGSNSCQAYPYGGYKPTGLLHEFGEDDSMMFGLLSGSYENNLDGGVLRKAVASFTDEVNANTGQFTGVEGIVKTIDSFKTVNFNDSAGSYSCGWITNRAINNGECDMWGNPVAEMMYESMRYFAGKGAPTSDFDIAATGNNDASLGLSRATWSDPYDASTGYSECSVPFQVVVTDINPSYDSDKVPGAHADFGSSFTGDITGLNVSDLADTITLGEGNISGNDFFIGQSGAVSDTAPTAKTVDSLASVRGMAPEEPTKLGSYYAASLAYYGYTNDLNNRVGDQKLQTFSVAMASPLPTIEIAVPGGSVVVVPFAKSAGQSGSLWTGFNPTNQIVDFYVESLGATTGSFLVNFEDVEQGADHDMDAISRYTYTVNGDGTVTIDIDSIYAAGGIDQRMGYVISGTTKDGVYLEVRDTDGADYVYALDTPASIDAGDSRGTDRLGVTASRTFTPSTSSAAAFLKDPLWYAAKWGGFIEGDVENDAPDLESEWDTDGDGDPDNYFLVTNALNLKDQMEAAFDEVLARSGASSSLAVNSGSLNSETVIYQALFDTDGWVGLVKAIEFGDGVVGATNWEFSEQLAGQLSSSGGHNTNREIITINTDTGVGVPFRFPASYSSPTTSEISSDQISDLLSGIGSDQQDYGTDLVNYLRGDSSQELGSAGATRAFRERKSPLGDIVHSDPLYVIPPGFFFDDAWPTTIGGVSATAPENAASQKYSDFRTLLKDRTDVLYVGANDGALHAINAYKNVPATGSDPAITGGGDEILAYVPGELYGKLPAFASQAYSHDYYVDGKTTYSDVFFSGDSKWHTALVGALRGGGQGIYGLDITDPHGIASASGYPSFDEANADDLVLWEFTDEDDADLGFTYGRPTITRLANGQWAAIFGNGYNNTETDGTASSTGNAIIYVVNIETGALIRKFDTAVGMSADPTSSGKPNGMSEPAIVDVDGDSIADTIYAGDLFGNLWKIDISSVNSATWDFSFYSGSDPAPLYVARSSGGVRLPITQQPKIGTHPLSGAVEEYLVFFGTGKYLENSDNTASSQETQSLFGIWDDGTNGKSRSDLLSQTLTNYTVDGSTFRVLSDNAIRWEDELDEFGALVASKHGGWMIDLVDVGASPLDNLGERSISNMILRDGRLFISTMAPSANACDYGGTGWLMIVDAAAGSRYLGGAVLDINNDGVIDNLDMIDTDGDGEGDTHVTGLQHESGFTGTVTTVDDGEEVKVVCNTTDGDICTETSIGNELIDKRLNWRELR